MLEKTKGFAMARSLRAVGPDEKPQVAPPSSMTEATERDRRSYLVRARLQLASAIDAGVPAHALARLISEGNLIDAEIRRLDALADEEARGVAATVEDGRFDASAV